MAHAPICSAAWSSVMPWQAAPDHLRVDLLKGLHAPRYQGTAVPWKELLASRWIDTLLPDT